MNLNNFTIKASEVLQQAQQLAFNAHNPTIETEHLMKALLDQEDSPVEYLLKKNNVTIPVLETKLDELIKKLPKSSGSDPAQTLSREANNVVLRAGSVLKQFGDEFITPEHLVLAVAGRDLVGHRSRPFGCVSRDTERASNARGRGARPRPRVAATQARTDESSPSDTA